MATTALVLYLLYGTAAFGWRAAVQRRRTGDSGFRGFSGGPNSAEWWAGALFVVALLAGASAPLADLLGLIEPFPALAASWLQLAGVALAGIGIAGTLAAQVAMGDSWRVGVDADERTELVTDGPFALARNPIFTMMAITALGLTAMVPNALALAGLVGLAVGLELQVRIVEEPFLARVQPGYDAYAARVGRFLPGIGRLAAGPVM